MKQLIPGLAFSVVTLAFLVSTSQVQAQANGGAGGRNFDPTQLQQRIMDFVRERLDFTNDTDWSAVQPLVQKVIDANREAGVGSGIINFALKRMFSGGNRRGGAGGNRGNAGLGAVFRGPSQEETELQRAIDDGAPAAEVKNLLDKYRAERDAKQAKLQAAQDELRKVLTVRQEAQAALFGLVP